MQAATPFLKGASTPQGCKADTGEKRVKTSGVLPRVGDTSKSLILGERGRAGKTDRF